MALQSVTALSSITMQESSQSVVFSGIPNTYKDLVIVGVFTSTGSTALRIKINDSSSFTGVFLRATTTDADSGSLTEDISYLYGNKPTQLELTIPDASATDKHKSLITKEGNPEYQSVIRYQRHDSTSAVSSIELYAPSAPFTAKISLFGRIA
jgi:hypothetical protein